LVRLLKSFPLFGEGFHLEFWRVEHPINIL
jgi:hypothetical protein